MVSHHQGGLCSTVMLRPALHSIAASCRSNVMARNGEEVIALYTVCASIRPLEQRAPGARRAIETGVCKRIPNI